MSFGSDAIQGTCLKTAVNLGQMDCTRTNDEAVSSSSELCCHRHRYLHHASELEIVASSMHLLHPFSRG